MDLTTILGAASLTGIVAVGALTGELPAVFLNWHGLAIVVGGTAVAMLVNTPARYLFDAAEALGLLVSGGRFSGLDATVASLLSLAEDVRSRGLSALQEADPRAAGGFLRRAAEAAVEYNDPDLVAEVLETEIDRDYDRLNEVINVYRTAGVLAPMFGLLGTLIGIVQVLRLITSPEQVASAMAVAVTTAFYGILLANAFCIPIAGKLRLRNEEAYLAKRMVKEALVLTLKGVVPLVIGRKLRAMS